MGEPEKVYGIIVGYRRGPNQQYTNQVIMKIDGVVNRRQAARFIGSLVKIVDKHGNVYKGKIVGTHGCKGYVRAVFKPNLPGQLIGVTATIEVK